MMKLTTDCFIGDFFVVIVLGVFHFKELEISK